MFQGQCFSPNYPLQKITSEPWCVYVDIHASHLIKEGWKQATSKVYFVQIEFASGNNFWAESFLQKHGLQCSETNPDTLPLTRDSQRSFSTIALLAICLAVTRAMHSSHQTKPLSVLTGLMGTRCSWVSLDLSHTGTAGSALIRHKQVSSSLQQPFIFWPTPTLRHLKTFNWLLHFLWSQEEGGVYAIMSLLKVSEL